MAANQINFLPFELIRSFVIMGMSTKSYYCCYSDCYDEHGYDDSKMRISQHQRYSNGVSLTKEHWNSQEFCQSMQRLVNQHLSSHLMNNLSFHIHQCFLNLISHLNLRIAQTTSAQTILSLYFQQAESLNDLNRFDLQSTNINRLSHFQMASPAHLLTLHLNSLWFPLNITIQLDYLIFFCFIDNYFHYFFLNLQNVFVLLISLRRLDLASGSITRYPYSFSLLKLILCGHNHPACIDYFSFYFLEIPPHNFYFLHFQRDLFRKVVHFLQLSFLLYSDHQHLSPIKW